MDPISLAIAGIGLVKGFADQASARSTSNAAMANQQQNLANALAESRYNNQQRMQMAGGLREDQFGNATYYDPAQGRWVTSFTPMQQRLIGQGQERQFRANTRGAQASQDYDTLRGEYLYDKPKTEDQAYSEIVQLINDARGTGERGLNTLMNRFGIRTAGNLPSVQQMDTGPTPGQQLAETMLKARQAALDESLKRKAGHSAEYLPAMKQFESTANYMAPVDPTGSGIIGMGEEGRKQQQGAMGDFEKLIAQIYGQGGQGMNTASAMALKADTSGPQPSDFAKIAQLMQSKGGSAGAKSGGSTGGTLGGTQGATYNSSGSPVWNDNPIGMTSARYEPDPYQSPYGNMPTEYWGNF